MLKNAKIGVTACFYCDRCMSRWGAPAPADVVALLEKRIIESGRSADVNPCMNGRSCEVGAPRKAAPARIAI